MGILSEWKGLIETRDPCVWIDRHVKRNELNQPFALYQHQRAILSICFDFDADGKLPWDTILYSAVKKSGKTSMLALLALYWAMTQEAPNEIILLANDLEQTQARAYASIVKILRYNPEIDPAATVNNKEIHFSNDSVIKPIASEYAGASGSNHGFVGLDELWAYTSERSRRLYEELTSVPTRTNSIKVVATYSGFEGESKLLWDLYVQAVDGDEHKDGQGVCLHPDLPVYGNREARIVAYWDHEPRFIWQTPQYYASQKRTLRAGAYLRFHENRWVTAETTFIVPELWDQCVDPTCRSVLPTKKVALYGGVDAGIKHDNAAAVFVYWEGEHLTLGPARIWSPTPDHPLNLEETIEAYLSAVSAAYDIKDIRCDPYQLHRSITTLKAKGLPIQEYPQTVANLTAMGQSLFDLLNGRNLRLYPSDQLRQQALNTVAIESPRGWRIAKEKASKKIDAIIALGMACAAALEVAGREPPQVEAPLVLYQRSPWIVGSDQPLPQ